MKPTKEEIRQKAVEYINKNGESGIIMCDTYDLVNFANSLFKETEEETAERLLNLCGRQINRAQSIEVLKKYHSERNKIENE